MILDGDASVIDALRDKKKLMNEGSDHSHMRLLLIIDGGLMKGVYGVGAAMALQELGFSHVFSDVVGVSSGAPTAAYFLAEDTKRGSTIIVEEVASKKFFNMWRIFNQGDTRFLINVLKGSTGKKLDAERVLKHKTKLHVGVSHYKTAKPTLINPQTDVELYNALHASFSMPGVSVEKVYVRGERYVDGGFTKPHIIKEAVESINATHILLITNQDKGVSTVPRLERFINTLFFRFRMSRALLSAARHRREERLRTLKEYKESLETPMAIIWGDGSIGSFERASEKVNETIIKSRVWWYELLRNKAS
jgi:predicted patatin/cPLA2 family phospholipase